MASAYRAAWGAHTRKEHVLQSRDRRSALQRCHSRTAIWGAVPRAKNSGQIQHGTEVLLACCWSVYCSARQGQRRAGRSIDGHEQQCLGNAQDVVAGSGPQKFPTISFTVNLYIFSWISELILRISRLTLSDASLMPPWRRASTPRSRRNLRLQLPITTRKCSA